MEHFLLQLFIFLAAAAIAVPAAKKLGLGSVLGYLIAGILAAMFLHGGLTHLLGNMLFLWLFGCMLEPGMGRLHFLALYLVSGVCGDLFFALFNLQSSTPLIGASGAIFGVFVAYGMIFAERTVLFMLIFPMKARTMVWIMIGLNAFYLVSQSGGNVSYIAHIAGGLAGFLYLKRAWRVGEFYRDLKWKFRRRKIKVVPPRDPDDRWLN